MEPSCLQKFRLPNIIPAVRTKVVEFTRGKNSDIPTIIATDVTKLGQDGASTEPNAAVLTTAVEAKSSQTEAAESGRIESATFKGGHHEQAQDSEFSFNYKLSALERFAVESAQAQADAGLPRMNVEAPDEIPVETQLRARAAEIFIDWKNRAVRKTQDAMQRAVSDADCGVVNLRHAIEQAKLSQHKAVKVQQDLETAKAETVGKSRTVEYVRHIPFWFYLVLVGILMSVEWVANVAVFRALLPIDIDADRNLRTLTGSVDGWGAGIEHTLAKFAVSPEAGILAVGTIVILMYLAHVAGESLRRLIAFRKDDDPAIAHGLLSEGRQAKNALIFSACGILAILLFLTVARSRIGGIADHQYEDAHEKTVALQLKHDTALSAGKLDDAQELNRQIAIAERSEQSRLENRDYAKSITSINVTIVFLNLGLVLVATVAAYQVSKGQLTESRIQDPAVASLQNELNALFEEVMNQRHKARSLDVEVGANISRAYYLSKASPTADWQAKVERLNAVVSLFRTTNATLRGIDPQNILAFQRFHSVEVAPPTNDELKVPDTLLKCEAEYKRLKQHLDFMQNDLLPSEGTQASA